jgi:RNA polymerase sigma-70 factor (ECF subfamily)
MAALPQEGRVDALEHVYRSRHGRFLRVALAILHDSERARDAVQETFARAVRAQPSYRGDGPLEAWLWRTLTNVCLDAQRRAVREAAAVPVAPAGGEAAEWPVLHAAIAALPERQRLTLFLRHYADLDYDAIADVLGVRRGTVAACLNAAHAKLRQQLEGQR